ncbi:MAG: acetolactate decarboxylase [Thiohalocapsa sp.]
MRTLLIALGLVASVAAHADQRNDQLYQVSTMDALLSGVYDSVATVSSVTEHGDFGLGTFAALDGELMLLDGVVYQAVFDGTVNAMPPSTGAPFMAVTRFEADQVHDVPEAQDYATFQRWLKDKLPSDNLCYAVRVDGGFAHISYRSVPPQEKPYAPLGEVIANEQTVFEQKNIDGTLMGFWCPAFSEGINVPGFHLHFLSADRRRGGHLLNFKSANATTSVDTTAMRNISLPSITNYLRADLSDDRSAELQAVEQSPGAAEAAPESIRDDDRIVKVAPSVLHNSRSLGSEHWRSMVGPAKGDNALPRAAVRAGYSVALSRASHPPAARQASARRWP